MDIRLIKSEKDHKWALQRIEALMDSAPDTPENDELDVLVTLVEVYEEKNFPIEAPDPIEAIKFRMEQMGLKQIDVAHYFGGRPKVSEVLSGKRDLSITMIIKLHKGLKIPYENMMQRTA